MSEELKYQTFIGTILISPIEGQKISIKQHPILGIDSKEGQSDLIFTLYPILANTEEELVTSYLTNFLFLLASHNCSSSKDNVEIELNRLKHKYMPWMNQ